MPFFLVKILHLSIWAQESVNLLPVYYLNMVVTQISGKYIFTFDIKHSFKKSIINPNNADKKKYEIYLIV